jgi:hypothetical protein
MKRSSKSASKAKSGKSARKVKSQTRWAGTEKTTSPDQAQGGSGESAA